MRPLIGLVLFAQAIGGPCVAQDPPAPPGGFAVQALLDQDWTWSDGYRTRFDLHVPAVAPPPGGWPAVTVHHGAGGDRKLPDVVRAARYLAAAGYVCYAYDGRDNGQTPALNPTWSAPRTPERILLDQAESLGAAQTLMPGAIDGARWALTGFSGGGRRSLWGAGWSGRLLPLAGSVAHHPVVSAIAPEIAVIDMPNTAAPGLVLAGDFKVKGLPPTDPMMVALQAGDYPSFAAAAVTTFDLQAAALLRTSLVPMLGMWAQQDVKIVSGPSIRAFMALPTPAPRRLHLSTGGHDTVKNAHERDLQQDLRRRWFDRFLKGIRNGVEREPVAELAVQPTTDARHANLATIWEHRNAGQWPPATQTITVRSYLRSGGVLHANAPSTVEAGPLLQHRVAPGYDALSYVAQGAGLAHASVLAQIPMVAARFDGAPLPADTELLGVPRLTLHVSDTTGQAQLTARLGHVDPAGRETWICMGTHGVRSAPGQHTIVIELDDVAHVIPAGHRVRVTVQNLALHQPPAASGRIRWVPYFTDTDTTVLMQPGQASQLELPVRAYRANLLPRLAVASATAGVAHRMQLRGGAARAGEIYAAFFGASGEAPGVALPGLPPAPLNPDPWTSAAIALQNSAAFPNTLGVLDASGTATPGVYFTPPVAAALVGIRFTCSAAVLSGANIEAFTDATSLVIDP